VQFISRLRRNINFWNKPKHTKPTEFKLYTRFTHSNCHISFTHYFGIPPIADLYVARCNKAVKTACLPTEKNTGSTAFTTFTARVLLCTRVCTWSILQSEAAFINGLTKLCVIWQDDMCMYCLIDVLSFVSNVRGLEL